VCDSTSAEPTGVTETAPAQQLAAVADAYYGDSGRLALEFLQAGKPVMIQDVTIMERN
jgi:hypothetical protein